MQPGDWEQCKARVDSLKQRFEELESGFSVKQDLDFDRDRGVTFRFDPKGGGRSLLLRLDLEILQDYGVDDIVRLMEKSRWQTLLSQAPEGKYLRFRESGLELSTVFCDLM
jgi:hypothetical protein